MLCASGTHSRGITRAQVHHPWDPLFRRLGLDTAADHHVHHRTFIYNYGHTMMWWDLLAGTYKRPETVSTFNKSSETQVQGGSNLGAPRAGLKEQ